MKPKSNLFQKFFSFFFALSTLLEPLAQAADYQIDVSESQVREFIKVTDLDNPKQTMSEFFARVEKIVPERVSRQMQPWFEAHSHEKMPDLDVAKFKDTDGKQKFRLTLTKGSESISISFLGEDERMVKVGSVPLMLEDILKFKPMFERLYAHIPALREAKGEASAARIVNRPRDEYAGFFAFPTVATFKKMTPTQRAEMVVRLRQVWNASQEVRVQMQRYKGGRRSAEYQHEVFHDYFFAALFGTAAEAQANIYYDKESKGCIDSGWLGEWDGRSCNSTEKELYKNLIDRAKNAPKCRASFCNPAIYGYDSGGNPICTVNKKSRQNATHFEGACDAGSRLLKQKIIPDLGINPNTLNDDDINKDAIRNKILAEAGSEVKAETERMLKSMLKVGIRTTDGDVGPIDGVQADKIFAGTADPKSIVAFEAVVKGFYDDITASLTACSKMEFPDNLLKNNNVNESNDRSQQLNACRQLWRRKLAFDAGMSQICPVVHNGKGQFEIPSLTCRKLDPEPKPPVVCDPVTQDTVIQTIGVNEIISCNCKAEFPFKKEGKCLKNVDEKKGGGEKGGNATQCKKNVVNYSEFDLKTCKCNDNTEPVVRNNGGLYCGSEDRKDIPPRRAEKCKDPSFSQWFSCNANWLAPVAGLAVIAGTYMYIRKDSKRTQQNATDLCPGTTQVCPGGVTPNQCKSPLVYNFSTGLCYLSCAPGLTPDYTTNTCVSTGTTPTCVVGTVTNCLCNGTIVANYDACVAPSYTCPDGTKVANSTLCVNQYTCPNGLKVASPAQCPVSLQKANSEEVQGTIRKIDPGQK